MSLKYYVQHHSLNKLLIWQINSFTAPYSIDMGTIYRVFKNSYSHIMNIRHQAENLELIQIIEINIL